LIMGSYIWDMV